MVIRSTLPDVEIPQVNLIRFLFENRNNTPEDRELFIDALNGKSLTFAEIKDNVLRFAAGLQDKLNFQRGDILAVFSPNQYDYTVPLLGTVAAGGSTTTANPSYTSRELIYQLETTKAKAIVAHEGNVQVAIEAARAVGIPKSNIFVFGDQTVHGVLPYTQVLLANRHVVLEELSPKEANERVTYLCFSSGTTGRSKGVMSTHTNIIANIQQYCALERGYLNGDHDKMIAVVPMFHIMGLVLKAHVGLYMGVPVYVMAKFDLPQFLDTIQNKRITFTVVAPPVVLALAKNPIVSNYDLSSLRVITSGAAPLGGDVARLVRERIPTVAVKQGYGTTETTACVFIEPTDRIIDGSTGILLPNIEIKIVNEQGKDVPAGERGELLIKGPNVMKGYINNPEATAESLDFEGYYHTGDIVLDKDGHFFVVDRIKELIKYKGFQVPPAELEALLLKSDIIADCAVIGVYDPEQATEVPQGCIVLKAGVPASKETEEIIKKYISGMVVYYKQLRRIVFVSEIPKNPSGKILRRILRDSIKQEPVKARL